MYAGRMVFAQLLDFLPKHELRQCVRRYRGDFHVRRLSCYDQFICLAFAQLTFRESLRDIQTCLEAMQTKLYHAGLRGSAARSTLADANEKRSWQIFADLAQVLIARARKLYAQEPLGIELEETAYAFDSTTIDLCLSLFPWAHFRRAKGAVKLHTLIDLRSSIPCFVLVSHGKYSDVSSLDDLPIEAGAFYVFDRGYTDFERLYRFTTSSAFFVTRGKSDLDFRCRRSRRVDKKTGLRCDQDIRLQGPRTRHRYPVVLRRIVYVEPQEGRRFVFLTNNMALPALTIAQLYQSRWRIELFFRWIKQHLRIKAFYGTSANAVKTQVWVAISVYVLVAILKKQLRLERSMAEVLQILSLTLFEKTPISRVLSQSAPLPSEARSPKQASLFGF
jgi:hypothetical protein